VPTFCVARWNGSVWASIGGDVPLSEARALTIAVNGGTGCSGGAGPVTLAAQNGAWVGGPLRARASGMTRSCPAVRPATGMRRRRWQMRLRGC
jgi:hypothetical protein